MDTEDRLRCRAVQQVWLPNLKVWARMPAQSDPGASVRAAGAGASSRGGAEAASSTVLPAAAQNSPQQSYTGFGAVHEGTDSDCEIVEDGGSDSGGLPMCPICLGEIVDLRDKAVVISCMHVFCLACLSRWSALKKSCPLCKRRIQGYMHSIQSDQTYQTNMLPETPPREPDKAPPSPLRYGSSSRPIIDLDPPRRLRAPSPGRTSASGGSAVRLLHDAPRSARERPSISDSFRRGSRNLIEEWVPGMWPPVRAPRRPAQCTSGAAAPDAAAGPRPYFYRVQAQAQSQVRGGHLATRPGLLHEGGEAAQARDAAEAFRRHVYVQGLYAKPLDEAALGAAPPSMSEERRQQRLQAWVDRELRALLQSEDTAIVRAYVMGLVRGIGFSAASSSRGSAGQAASGACSRQQEDAVAALRPFLQEQAGHFWHELRCFAAVAVSMQTYDRIVKYGQQPGRLDAHAEHGPSRTAEAGAAREEGRRSAADRNRRYTSASASGSRRVRRRFSDEPPFEDRVLYMEAAGPRSEGRNEGGSTSSQHARAHADQADSSGAGLAEGCDDRGARRAEGVADRQGGPAQEDVLAKLRRKALAQLEARRQK